MQSPQIGGPCIDPYKKCNQPRRKWGGGLRWLTAKVCRAKTQRSEEYSEGPALVKENVNTTIAAEIVAAYVSNSSVAMADLLSLMRDVLTALERITRGESAQVPTEVKQVPAVPIKKSLTPDFIISLEDGKKFKSLKRHLSAEHGMTPAEYRAKWGLADDYPMVAPIYAATRSRLAISTGLGQVRKKSLAHKGK
jgi:predicted transcriptional regulator